MPSHTCPRPENWDDLQIDAGNIVGNFTFQNIISYVASGLTVVTLALSLWLIFKHLNRYTFPSQQRQIIRIIFVPVVFAAFSLLGLFFYSAEPYLTPVRDLYEIFCIGAIFFLFADYVTPNYPAHEKIKYFDSLPPPNAGYKRRYTIVFLCIIAGVLVTIINLITLAADTYCDTSLSPHFGHLWVTIIKSAATAISAVSVIMLYKRLKPIPEFSRHRPLIKLISFKLIVGLNFLQTILFNIITTHGIVHGSKKITGKDIQYGIPNLIIVIEQVAFAIFFHYSFRSREYHEDQLDGQANKKGFVAAAGNAFNPIDLLEGMAHAIGNIGGFLAQRRGGRGPRGPTKYQSMNIGPQFHGQAQDQEAFLQSGPIAYEMNRSPSPVAPNYYQPPAGSPRK